MESFFDPYCRETFEAALDLAGRGYAVFPCIWATKQPAKGTRGFYDATTNPAVIRRWYGGNFKRNLAVRTGAASSLWVLDFDTPEALDGLIADHGPLPATATVRTARGLHMWWRMAGVPIPCSTGRVAEDVDVKGDGGYALAPPSIHPDGIPYEWMNDGPVVEAPAWLVQLALKRPQASARTPGTVNINVTPGSYGQAALAKEIAILAGTAAGNRNNQLNRSGFVLFQLVAGGELDDATVERALEDAAKANGLMDDDGHRSVMATIRSSRDGLQFPRSRNGRP